MVARCEDEAQFLNFIKYDINEVSSIYMNIIDKMNNMVPIA